MLPATFRPLVRAVVCLVVFVLPMSACPPKYIPHTEIQDTPDNRAIMDIIHAYKDGFEAKDSKAIMSLASPRYLDSRDSIGYETLEKQLSYYFERVRQDHLDLSPRRIVVEGEHARVDYIFALSYILNSAQPKWVSQTDDKRMTLARENGRWRVTSGF
jgi:hypothetical protein